MVRKIKKKFVWNIWNILSILFFIISFFLFARLGFAIEQTAFSVEGHIGDAGGSMALDGSEQMVSTFISALFCAGIGWLLLYIGKKSK